MAWLVFILHLFIGTTLAGVGIVVVLVIGFQSPWALAGAVVAGLLLAFPLAWVVARALMGDGT
ncbi:CTP synthetase [Roseovarius sp. EGI FJ00037]|uniref:CTP synthetase n=1 Tax=Roseovarius TaxID=74030 RepID=UPI0022A87705|nr:CTP synthetase [Roseovarius sp. EGI FJ00037]MCZ0812965.1 CTP synthetase [Roseovarius sp. EGI FJ00037]